MLARTVEILRSVPVRGNAELDGPVTVIGQRTLLEGADRAIPDTCPGCGPLGGIEAALSDLMSRGSSMHWALFLPVDMPFLPAGLVRALLEEWAFAAAQGVMASLVVVDGQAQPLVSLVHRAMQPFLIDALGAGEFRVTPVLRSACKALASQNGEAIVSSNTLLGETVFTPGRICPIDKAWSPTSAERRARPLWFANLNTERDLERAETFLRDQG